MIAINPMVALDFNTALAQAKLEALNILRNLLTSADPPDSAPHQRLAATQILRTTFINLARPRVRTDPTPGPAPAPEPEPADQQPQPLDPVDLTPDDVEALINNIPPERFLEIIDALPGGRLVGSNPRQQARINAQLLQALRQAQPKPP